MSRTTETGPGSGAGAVAAPREGAASDRADSDAPRGTTRRGLLGAATAGLWALAARRKGRGGPARDRRSSRRRRWIGHS